jgi:transcriptional regulator with XRE-family HTH domain
MTEVRDEETAARRQQRREDEPGTGVVTAFGRQLQLLRTRAGLKRAEFGKRLGYSADTVASIEQGRRLPQPQFIEKADEVLRAGGVLTALKEEVGKPQYPAFSRDTARLESDAHELFLYAVQAVPGRLQTEEYTRALLACGDRCSIRTRSNSGSQPYCRVRDVRSLASTTSELRHRGGRVAQAVRWSARAARVLENILLIGHRRNVEVQVMPNDQEDNAGVD